MINTIGLVIWIAAMCLPFLMLGFFVWRGHEVRRHCEWLNSDEPAAIAAQMEPSEWYDPKRHEIHAADDRLPPRKRLNWEAR